MQRNKVRRRIRGMLRDEQLIFLDGSYLFCITAGAKELSYAELRTHVQRALMFLSRKCS